MKIEWSTEQHKAFKDLKLAIATASVLMTYHPDQTRNGFANRQMDKTGPDLKTFFDRTAELYPRKGLILILERIIPPEP